MNQTIVTKPENFIKSEATVNANNPSLSTENFFSRTIDFIPIFLKKETTLGLRAIHRATISFGIFWIAAVIYMSLGSTGLLFVFCMAALTLWRAPWSNAHAKSWDSILKGGLSQPAKS